MNGMLSEISHVADLLHSYNTDRQRGINERRQFL